MAYLKTVCSVALKMLLKWDKVSAKEELVGKKTRSTADEQYLNIDTKIRTNPAKTQHRCGAAFQAVVFWILLTMEL